MATGIYPAIGTPLYLASSNPQEPVWAGMRDPTEAIPDGSFSMGIPLNAGITTSFNVKYGTAPSGTAVEIRYAMTPDFDSEIVLDTVPASGTDKIYVWSSADVIELDGFIRLKNTGGQTVTAAFGQQRASFSN